MMKVILINHSERSPVPKMSKESYRKSRHSGCEPTVNGRKSAMDTVITCHNCERPEHKKKNCNWLNKTPNKPSDVESGKIK